MTMALFQYKDYLSYYRDFHDKDKRASYLYNVYILSNKMISLYCDGTNAFICGWQILCMSKLITWQGYQCLTCSCTAGFIFPPLFGKLTKDKYSALDQSLPNKLCQQLMFDPQVAPKLIGICKKGFLSYGIIFCSCIYIYVIISVITKWSLLYEWKFLPVKG